MKVNEVLIASLRKDYRKGPQGETPREGKVFLRVPHYRLLEIDESEMNNLVRVIKNSGADTCEDTIVNVFLRFLKKQMKGSSLILQDREVMDLWEQFKDVSSCLLRREGM